LERTLASLPGYFYSTSSEGLYIHLYDNSELNWRLESGNAVRVTQTTKYPWDGRVALNVSAAQPEEFTLFLRIPDWSRNSTVSVAGKPLANVVPGSYCAIRRLWSKNETVELNLDMTTRFLQANPAVAEDTGSVAVQRGPVVFCMEQLDQARLTPEQFPLLSANLTGATSAQYTPDLLDGVVVLTHEGLLESAEASAALYEPATPSDRNKRHKTSLRLVPYYAWANREPSEMKVWIPYTSA
jgi:DUF1680 family protein